MCIDTHPPPMYGTSSPPMRLPRPHDPPAYASPIDMSKQSRGDHRGTTPHRSDTSYEEDEAYSPHRHMPHSNQFRDVVGQSIPDTRHYTTSTSATNRGDIPYQSK